MTIYEFLNHLQQVKKLHENDFMALCPAHADKKPSLHIKDVEGHILISCQAGCQTEAVVQALDLQMSDLFTEAKPTAPKVESKLVATYPYKDEKGNVLFEVCRFDPKDFRPRHRNGGGEWAWNMEGVRRVLYHLPDVLLSDTVYLVEGEKDADNLCASGLIATTSPGGANNWRPEYADFLSGKHVVLIPDKDSPGYEYSRNAVQSLRNKARGIQAIILPGKAKDISDWLDDGGDVALLPTMMQDVNVLFEASRPVYSRDGEAIKWEKELQGHTLVFRAEKLSEERTGVHGRASITFDYQNLGWSYFNLERAEDRLRIANTAHKGIKGDFAKQYAAEDLRRDFDAFIGGLWQFHISQFAVEEMAGDANPKPLTFFLRPYLLQGGGTILFAPPGRGKSYTALLWGVSIDAGCTKYWPVTQSRVLIINLERSKESLTRRLGAVNRILGLPPTRSILTLNARGKTMAEVIAACRKAIAHYNVQFVILDSLSRAGLGDLNDNQPVNKIIDALNSLCPSWLALGHTSRANEEHLFGSIMADAGADIVVQLASEIASDGTLGVGWAITKQNDVPGNQQQIFALEFDDVNGLTSFRKAKSAEFVAIEGKQPGNMLDTIIDYISGLESGDATATEIEHNLGYSRATISKLFTKSGRFYLTKRIKQNVYYGVKSIP